MPTYPELLSIVDPASSNHVYEDFFTVLASKPYGYWSSSTLKDYDYDTEVTKSLVLSYQNAFHNSYIWITTKYNMNFMCVQKL